ncbi:MAG: hypothetical protein FJ395_07390 [Verrucomicrobia bacterium]|nr:hypothetical protein [Verrucomicrobiota bacterium]
MLTCLRTILIAGALTICSFSSSADDCSALDSNAIARIQKLAALENLRLSTGPVSWAEKFRFKFREVIPQKLFASVPSREVIVVRDKGDIALLVQTTNGLPCYCINTRLFLGLLSPSDPGELVIHRGGGPLFQFNNIGKTNVNVLAGYVAPEDAGIDFDLGSILQAFLPHITKATYDDGTKTINARMIQTSFRVQLADSEAASTFPIREICITPTDRPIWTVTDIICGEKIPKGLLRVRQEELKSIGLPLQVLPDSQFIDIKMPFAFATDMDERGRHAAEKLRDFFRQRDRAKANSTPP